MSQEPSSLEAVLLTLERPLKYVSRKNFANLSRVKDLEQSLRQVLADMPKESLGNELWKEIAQSIEGLDRISPSAKRNRIRKLLFLIESAKSGKSPVAIREFKSAVKELSVPVQYLKGVGPRVAQMLERRELRTVEDVLYHLPARWEDRRELVTISRVRPGERVTVKGEIVAVGLPRRKAKMRAFEMAVDDGTGTLICKWFHYQGDYLEKRYHKGQHVIITEVPRLYGGKMEMHHPDVEIISEGSILRSSRTATAKDEYGRDEHDEDHDDLDHLRIVPIYPATEGLYQKTLRRIIRQALDGYLHLVPDVVPPSLRKNRGLPDIAGALRQVHAPDMHADVQELNRFRSPAHKRLVYEEFFLLELCLALQRQGIIEEPAIPISGSGRLAQNLLSRLPFKLTSAQDRVIEEISKDLKRPRPMHRLLQGDVGSGKTVVAVLAALYAVEDNLQVAIMAPTEILAEQHYLNMHRFLEDAGVRVILLSAAVRGTARKQALFEIEQGRVDIVVGTHAVIQEKVKFARLGLGIIDEQHRFGVLQRARLKAKGAEGTTPHVLVMTATPIPRTLAMTVYGDLDLSVLDEMPPGRQPVLTQVFPEKDRREVYAIVREEVERGGQVFVVYPLVEESRKLDLMDATRMAEHFQNDIFPQFRVGLLHGRMKPEEKEFIMRAFKAKELDILVATTVIEVGIDVPNASIMLTEHAERFGLSQLHQLRGRVGRGERKSRCLLLAQYTRSDDAWRRLKIMEETNDGFRIAEEDLAIRGPGEFLGTRQSGLPDFRIANILRDAKVLSEARTDAFRLIEQDPELEKPEHQLLKQVLIKRWGKRINLARVG
jgi:ATP-dependent DNA helicase RecG